MQILIIEDEPRAANQLQNLLKDCGFDYNLQAIIDTVEDSIAWFQNGGEADLVFMDIQLADGLSFEIFQNVTVNSPIIFTTAFDQYAIRAFKVNSVDYLLKPIQEQDLRHALDKFMSSKQNATVDMQMIQQLISTLQVSEQRESILVKEGDGYNQLRIADLLYVYSEDSMTFGVTATKRFIIEETIDALYNTLNPSEFFRINRGQIVSKHAIIKIDKYFNHRLKLNLKQPIDQEFIVSRQKVNDFKNWLNR
ncbi:MAG: DNA-binding response regulator [Winogradskyella sp.]|uniref:LytR/AlgR family response regulator transcription factor n=1 Tax=Winogradskyella sp. TaxID=1883156 RepID=UPI000F3AC624|nr:LytTR family DNA-binding domain-containing protein [Winogradskyella sp.]RNC86255.1 MAG: DNA-binding response regulator [Winogradskyella sp.]